MSKSPQGQGNGEEEASPTGAMSQQAGMSMLQQVSADRRETFTAVRKNGDGDITAFRTSAGRVLDYGQALREVQSGKIAGVNAFKGRDGETYIRGDADGDPSNNLDNLPTFS